LADLDSLQQDLEVNFKNVSLLEQALIHSSYANENPGLVSASNERLEFLGDAVLGVVVGEKLYRDHPDFSEGKMTKLRAALVRKETLARIAKSISLGEHLYLGKGEETSGGRHKQANLAAALEAVIAAVFLDRGGRVARDLILRLVEPELDKAMNHTMASDYKSELQELVQSSRQRAPTYHVIETSGPDHSKVFTVEVRLDGQVLGTGSGKSKKAAETEAARSALAKLPDLFTR
jgi:ribonuclease-3